MTKARELSQLGDKINIDDTDGYVGIGTSSPSAALHLGGSSNQTIQIEGASNTAYYGTNGDRGDLYVNYDPTDGTIPNSGRSVAGIQIDGANGGSNIRFRTTNANNTASTERMRIDSSGNVGIGTSSPSKSLHILNASSTGSTNPSHLRIEGNSSNYYDIGRDNSGTGYLSFYGSQTGATGYIFGGVDGERMRIDSSGNLLVGTTTTAGVVGGSTVAGSYLSPDGGLFASRSGSAVSTLNRQTSDGDIVQFRKDGTTVGAIGTASGDIFMVNGNLGLKINEGGNNFIPCSSTGSGRDNVMDVGAPTVRFDDIRATNGTIQTSDQNEKQQIASLTDAEITAAKAISKLFKTFKWNDSVTKKGDAARTHSGVIAQEVEQAMTDAGLNAGDYAFFISDTWWETQTEVPAVEADEENGVEAQEAYTRTDTYETAEEAPEGATERNRKGIRYPQLLSFIGAATEQRLASIESRLDALESA